MIVLWTHRIKALHDNHACNNARAANLAKGDPFSSSAMGIFIESFHFFDREVDSELLPHGLHV